MKNSISLLDLLSIGIAGAVCLTLCLPTVMRHRAAARSQQCAMNLKQLGLAMHNYHAAYNQLPPGLGGTTGGEDDTCNQGRLGPMVAMTPFIEQQALWEAIANPLVSPATGKRFPAMGPAPWYDADEYTPWSSSFSALHCPDDFQTEQPANAPEPIVVTTLAMPANLNGAPVGGSGVISNYVVCYGDGTSMVGEISDPESNDSMMRMRAGMRGVFTGNRAIKFRDCLDGLSNTIGMSEAISPGNNDAKESHIAQGIKGLSMNPSLCLATRDNGHANFWDVRRASRWADGTLAISGFQTVLPPNSPTCLSDRGFEDPIASASSRHAGGVHVLMMDGRVGFAGDTIDCGDLTQPGVSIEKGYAAPGSPSPFGLWGRLGTRASKEVINLPANGFEWSDVTIRNNRGRGAEPSQRPVWSTWTDAAGNVQLQAKLNRVIDRETVELEDGRGILHRVPLNTLSDADIFKAVTIAETEVAKKKE